MMSDYYVALVTDAEYDILWEAWIARYPVNGPGVLTARLTSILKPHSDKEVYVAASSREEATPLREFLLAELARVRQPKPTVEEY